MAPKGKTKYRKKPKQSGTKMYRQLKSMIEKKHIDKVISSEFANNVTVNNLCLIAEGVTSSTRNGLKIAAKTLYMKFSIQWKATATQETTGRLIVFIDRLSSGALPTASQLLETVSTTSQYNNINEGRRFIVLRDILYNNKNATTAISKLEGHSLRIPINKNIWYLDSTANVSALGRNSLYYVLIGDSLGGDPDCIAITGTCRLYYEDL